jgi:hypothetical protein
MLISQKHYCTEHQRSCYVNGSNHLHLTPQHLSTWAASIVSFAQCVTFRATFRITFCVTFRVTFYVIAYINYNYYYKF